MRARFSARASRRLVTYTRPSPDGTRVLVGYTFDHLPHIGTDGAIHQAMGYCGTGVAMASYFGHLLGRLVAGETDTVTPLDGMPFASAPFYRGEPWSLPFAFAWYAFKDRFG